MALAFTKLPNGNVILDHDGEKYSFRQNTSLKTDADHPNVVFIQHDELGQMKIDYNDVNVPVVASQAELFAELSENFFFDKIAGNTTGVDYSKDLILSEINIPEEAEPWFVMKTVTTRFIDYGLHGDANGTQHNSSYHYKYLSWDIVDGTIENIGLKFDSFDDLSDWFDNNYTGGKLKITAYFPVTLFADKLKNMIAINEAYKIYKGDDFYLYFNNQIRTVKWGGWSLLKSEEVLRNWDYFASEIGISPPPTDTDLSEVYISSKKNSLYSAYKNWNSDYVEKFKFTDSEGYGRRAWLPSDNRFIDINEILQNYQDPLPFYTIGDNANNVIVRYDHVSDEWDNLLGESLYPENDFFFRYSLIQFNLIFAQYNNGKEYVDCYAMALKPLGQDLFTTRYYDNTEYQLYYYLYSNAGKPIVRKVDESSDHVYYLGDESMDLGWQINKADMFQYIKGGKSVNFRGSFNRDNKTMRDLKFFVMKESTGEISPLSDFKISAKTHMRGSMFNLMLENK